MKDPSRVGGQGGLPREDETSSLGLRHEALFRILVRKGLVTQKELVEELEALARERAANARDEGDAYARHFGTGGPDRQF